MESIQRIELLISQKNYDMAIDSLNRLLSDDPTNARAIAYLALCKFETDKPDDAIIIAKRALAEDPNYDFALYVISLAHLRRDDFKKAMNAINKAISLDPDNAEYYGVSANIHIVNRDFSKAEGMAERGLELDPENLFCRNMLSMAQLKQGDKTSSFETVEKALELDPENVLTHANYGWGQLERGSHKKALEHFKEALSRNPEDEFARAGMLEALKAKYFIYRIFLRYYFFMANLKPNVQWVILIGIIFINRFVRKAAQSSPELGVILWPVFFLLIFFLVSTWVVEPVFNFFMSLNSYGKYLLKGEERRVSALVGVCFALFVLSILGWLATQSPGFVAGILVGYTLILPVGKSVESPKMGVRLFTSIYALLSSGLGILLIWTSFLENRLDDQFLFYYAILIVAFTWIWNFISTK